MPSGKKAFTEASRSATAIDAAEEQKLQELGQKDGAAGVPATSDSIFGETERSIQKEWQARLAAFDEELAAKLAVLRADIARQREKCALPSLSDEIAAVKTKISGLVIEQAPELAVLKTEEAASRKDLEDFRTRHGLARQPHNSASPAFSIGLLMVLALAEGGINAVLFAENNALGLLGGLLESFMLSGANVVFAALTGYVILKNWNARRTWRKALAFVGTLAAVLLIVSFNLLAAHYRDYRSLEAQLSASVAPRENTGAAPAILVGGREIASQSRSRDQKFPSSKAASTNAEDAASLQEERQRRREKAAAAERQALERFLSRPFGIQSFNGYILLFVSLCCVSLAAWKGYALDDEYPGYGRMHRRYLKAQRQFIEAQKTALIKLNRIFGTDIAKLNRKLDEAEEAIAALRRLHFAFGALRDKGASGWTNFEEGFHASLAIYREANNAARRSKAPPHFALYPPLRSTTKWPELSGEELAALQSLEAKLAKLRSAIEAISREAEAKLALAAEESSASAEVRADGAKALDGRSLQKGNLHVAGRPAWAP